jgi:RHS repeat-associated protein
MNTTRSALLMAGVLLTVEMSQGQGSGALKKTHLQDYENLLLVASMLGGLPVPDFENYKIEPDTPIASTRNNLGTSFAKGNLPGAPNDSFRTGECTVPANPLGIVKASTLAAPLQSPTTVKVALFIGTAIKVASLAGLVPYGSPATADTATWAGDFTDAQTGEDFGSGSLDRHGNLTVTPSGGTPVTVVLTLILPGTPHAETYSEDTKDPISTATGELLGGPFADLDLGGPLPLQFRRSYGTTLGAITGQTPLGYNWMSNFDPYLTLTGNLAVVAIEGGGSTSFQLNGSTYQTVFPARMAFQLVKNATGYRYLDPAQVLIYTFDATGHLTRIEDRNGNALTLTPGGPFNSPSEVSDGLGRTLTFTYSTAGNLIRVQDQTGRSVSYAQDANANLTAATDANGNTTAYVYAGNELAKTTLPLGNVPYTQAFDPNTGSAVKQTDSMGNTTTLAYVAGGTPGKTVMTDPLGRVTTYNYADLVDVSAVTDADGQTASYTYDSLHRPITATDRLGNKSSVTYDPASGYVASITDAKGSTTTFTYQSQVQGDFTFFNLTQIGYADGTTETYSYDASGNVLTATDGAGKTSKYTYNSRGQMLTATNPAGGVTTLTYNADGTVATRQDPAGNVTTYGYDSLKRLASIQRPDQSSVSFTRDALDQILSVTDERGKVTKFAYDANTNLKSVTDALNQSAKMSYDTDDLPAILTDPLGNSTMFQYDPLGSVTAVLNAAGEKNTYSYDNLERAQSALDPSGKGSSFTYDAEGRLATLTDALGNTAKFTVDQLGRTTGVSSPLSESTAIAYDALSRVTSITDPLSRTTSYSYENRGLPVGIGAPGGLSTSFAWGDLQVLTSFTDPNGNKWPLSHDSLGRLTSITDPLGHALTYAYDKRNRVSSVSSTADSVQIAYDAAGNAVQAKYSDGSFVVYTYDDDNRLTGGTGLSFGYDGAGRLTSSNGLATAYDGVGRITSVMYPPGKMTYSYDSRGLLSQISDWANGMVSFKFNDAHQLVSITRSNGVATQYSYDKDGRVASLAETSGGSALASINLTRDALGRVTASNRNLPQQASPTAGALPLGFDAANQISGFTYDARGRLTKGDGGSAYTWNPASRLVSYTRADGSASFTYDGLGQRISRTGPDGVAMNYVLNYALGLPSVAIVQSGKSDLRYYVYTPEGLLLYSIEAADGSHNFYSFDETGSTTFLTGDSGAVTGSYGISPYGEVITAASSNTSDNPFTWQGQFGVMQEPGASLFYMRFRYYDSTFARFLSRDPLFSPNPREVNPYQYAAGNPVSNFDPTGLKRSNLAEAQRISGITQPSTSTTPSATGIAITNTTNDPSGGMEQDALTAILNAAYIVFPKPIPGGGAPAKEGAPASPILSLQFENADPSVMSNQALAILQLLLK